MRSTFINQILAAALALMAFCLFRYQVIPIGGGESSGFAYRLDRWTGRMTFVAGDKEAPVTPVSKSP
jgi:hypothetical protein